MKNKKVKEGLCTVRLKCKKCKKLYTVRTNNAKIYTPKIRKNWICLMCKK
jgi:hypothetical protein